ncbi:MAG: hypothetical protein PWQ39_1340 [Thermacetogenium sp.]|nr:hypothetical protein [Thermacetogenium sp.]
MSTIVIACQTLSDEVNMAIAETGVKHPVIWVESGLHNHPETLRMRLQETVSRISNVENIILCYGYCGNSLLGLHSTRARLIVPRVDDCISLLLGSYEKREALSREMVSYFLTRGWIVNENNIIREYERCVERYGKERAQRVLKMMLEHYRRLILIDTGAYPLDDACLAKSYEIAEMMGLKHQVVKGSIGMLKQLLTGPWDENFIVLEPGEELSMDYFRIDMKDSLSNLSLFGFGKGGN